MLVFAGLETHMMHSFLFINYFWGYHQACMLWVQGSKRSVCAVHACMRLQLQICCFGCGACRVVHMHWLPLLLV